MNFTLSRHRAVDPVIANLIFIATAVVGGSVIFTASQGFFNDYQISGSPSIEFLELVGYDARDVSELQSQNDIFMATPNSGGDPNGAKQKDERIGVYVQNHSSQKVTIAKLLFAGKSYSYQETDTIDAYGPASIISGSGGVGGKPEYGILTKTDGIADIMQSDPSPVINPGKVDTIILALDGDYKIGRQVQFQLTTTQGAKIVGTIVVGSAGDSTGFGSIGLGGFGGGGGDNDDDDDDDD